MEMRSSRESQPPTLNQSSAQTTLQSCKHANNPSNTLDPRPSLDLVLNLSPGVILEHTEAGNIPGQKNGNIWQFIQSELETWSDRHDQRKILLRQAGAFAHDETLEAFQLEIDSQRQLNTCDSID